MDGGAWWAAVHGVAKSQTRLSDVTFTFHFHALQKAMATHSSVLAWRIPGTEEPGGLPSMGSHRVGHDWSDLAAAAAPEVCLDKLSLLEAPSLLVAQNHSFYSTFCTGTPQHLPSLLIISLTLLCLTMFPSPLHLGVLPWFSMHISTRTVSLLSHLFPSLSHVLFIFAFLSHCLECSTFLVLLKYFPRR